MRDLELGRLIRTLRRRRGLRQLDCALLASVHRSTWARLEGGHFEQLSLGTLRACLAAIEVKVDLIPHWRGAELDRLLDEDHSAIASRFHQRLQASRWEVRAEVSFNHFGDRGRVDLLAWHATTRALLIVEVKTEIADAQRLLGSLDVKARLAPVLAKAAGWPTPQRVAVLLLVAESTTNRRRIGRLEPLFSRFRRRGVAARRWLKQPVPLPEPMLVFTNLPPAHGRHPRRVSPTRIRPRKGASSVDTPSKSRSVAPNGG